MMIGKTLPTRWSWQARQSFSDLSIELDIHDGVFD